MVDIFSFLVILLFCILGTYLLTPVIGRFEAYCKGYKKGYNDAKTEQKERRHIDANLTN